MCDADASYMGLRGPANGRYWLTGVVLCYILHTCAGIPAWGQQVLWLIASGVAVWLGTL